MKHQTPAPRPHTLIALQIGLLFGVAALLRLADLGYSDFQGDEISALCRLSDFKTPLQFAAYLLGQRKGPVQYLVTCALSLFDPSFSSELAARLPFALASLAALACFFALVHRLFTLETALYASFLFATNGIFIAFARIVQYQSFVILGTVMALLGLTLALQHEKWRVPGLYLGSLSAALGLLAHFDAAFVLPPLAVLVLHWWLSFRHRPDFPRLRRHLLAAAALFTFLVLGFYAEYVRRLGTSQTEYWGQRFSGEPTDILRLFQFYNPGPVLWIYLLAAAIGLTRIRTSLRWQVLLAWLLPPLLFMSLIFKDSRTHAYTYLLPLLIAAGIGIDSFVRWLGRLRGGRLRPIAGALVLVSFLLCTYTGYALFVDHEPEYPWYPKRLLYMKAEGGDLTGTFGFPYGREWRKIGAWFTRLPNEDLTLVTNEKPQIASFYLPARVHYRYGHSEYPGPIRAREGLYFLVIRGPQSWMTELWGWSVDKWRERLVPEQEFVNQDGELVAAVYFLSQEEMEREFEGGE